MRYVIVRQPLWQFNVAHLLLSTLIAAIAFWAVHQDPRWKGLFWKDAKTLEVEAELARIEQAISLGTRENGWRPYQ